MTNLRRSGDEFLPETIADSALVAPLVRYAAKNPGQYISVKNEPAFVLTTWPWRETSLIVSFFTRRYGRMTAVARGAKKPAGRFRGLIDPFLPLLVNFSGRGEVKTLTGARWMGGLSPITGEGLITAFYLNELVFRLCPAEVAQTELFDAYTRTLSIIARGDCLHAECAMREFEVDLLRLCGWGQQLPDGSDGFDGLVRDGEIIQSRETAAESQEKVFTPEAVRAVLTRDFSDVSHLKEAREILRKIIEFYALGGRTLSSRRTLAKWRQFSKQGAL